MSVRGVRAGGDGMRGERIAVGEERGGELVGGLGINGGTRRAISSGAKVYCRYTSRLRPAPAMSATDWW